MWGSDNRKRKLYRTLAGIISAVFIFSFVTASAYTGEDVIKEVRGYLKTYYVDKLPDSVLNLPTVEDIIKEINKTDPHTKYFTPEQYAGFESSINNTFVGIGVLVERAYDGLEIKEVYSGSPAYAAKLKPGDIIMMADNHMLSGASFEEAIGYIKGPEGTKVNLKIRRDKELLSFSIARKSVNAPTVNGKILDNHIGYIQIVSFGSDTGRKFSQMVSDYQSKKVDSYIIDLRDNTGGYLSSALDIAGYFIGDEVALITRSQLYGEEKDNGVKHRNPIDKPVIFLINDYSASASELLSAAVKDYNKAYFLGIRSYGKGSVQIPQPLSNKYVLKFTIAKFFSPKGNAINKVGITPDMNVPNSIDSMRVAELMLDSQEALKSSVGYVKISAEGKTLVTKLSRIHEASFWQSYRHLIELARVNGSVMFGTDRGWKEASDSQMNNLAAMYFPDYKLQAKFDSAGRSSVFKVKFASKMLKSSINNKNIELIDVATGIRMPVTLSIITDKEVVVESKMYLKKGSKYYLVVNPDIKKADNKALGYGIIDDITVAK